MEKNATIPLALLQQIVNYLLMKPYGEVAELIKAIQEQHKVVEDETPTQDAT
jgi:hypothetical protein